MTGKIQLYMPTHRSFHELLLAKQRILRHTYTISIEAPISWVYLVSVTHTLSFDSSLATRTILEEAARGGRELPTG